MIINAVSACWSSYSYQDAIRLIHEGTVEPVFGKLAHEHVQLCPQHSQYLSEEVIDELMLDYPETQFRLHSDVRLVNKRGVTIDLIDFNEDTLWYFKTLAKFSKQMGAKLYSLHAGVRGDKTMNDLFEKCNQLREIFDCDIAIEGHYPFKNGKYLVSSWKEYEELFKSGLPYALDLSHLNIVAHREGWQYDLTQEMLSSPQCREVHLSFNDGIMDSHYISQEHHQKEWEIWKSMVEKAHKNAVIFSEGNQVLHLRKQARLNEEVSYLN